MENLQNIDDEDLGNLALEQLSKEAKSVKPGLLAHVLPSITSANSKEVEEILTNFFGFEKVQLLARVIIWALDEQEDD